MSDKHMTSAGFWVAVAAALGTLGGIGVAVGAVKLDPHQSPREPMFTLGIVLACLGILALWWG
jgi:hypothetical protein